MIMKQFHKLFLISIVLSASLVKAITIDRVILGCDANPMYLEFWPLVAKTWKEIVGVKPTLALIASAEVEIDESLGDVIRFDPIPGIPTAFQAQVIRLLLPILFPNEVCIISDMDMIPLQRDFFINNLAPHGYDKFVIFNDAGRYIQESPEYLMCYVAGLGRTFAEIFGISNVLEIPDRIKQWNTLSLGWTSDQRILYQAVNNWKDYSTRIVKLGYSEPNRIDRAYWFYYKDLVRRKNYYVDSHMLRPYSTYKKEIDALVEILFEK